MYSEQTGIEGPVDLRAQTIVYYFQGHKYSLAVEREIADAYVDVTGRAGQRTSVLVGQSGVETNRHNYGGQVLSGQFNFAGLGATDDGAQGISIKTPKEGVYYHCAHMCNYLYGEFSNWPERCKFLIPYAFRHKLVLERMKGRLVSQIGEFGDGVWATDPDYAGKLVRAANYLLTQNGEVPVGKYKHTRMFLPAGVNHWAGRNGHVPDGMVDHVAEGHAAGVKSWFNNPASESSTHLLVLKNGERWQFLDYGDTAWANGKLVNPNREDPFINSYVEKNINPNRRTISVETERFWQDRLTWQQIESMAELTVELHQQYKWPTDGSRVWAHGEFDSVNRARCPSFNKAEWEATTLRPLAEIGVIPPTIPIDQPNDTSFSYDVVTGYYIDQVFLEYYLNQGGWQFFGRPTGGSAGYTDGMIRQQFENVTLQADPKTSRISLASLGTAYTQATGQKYTTWAQAQPQL